MKRSLLLLVAAATAHSPVAPMLRRLALLKQRRPHALANVGFGCCLTAATIKDELALRCTLLTATVFFLSNNLASALSTSGTVNWPGAACQCILVGGHWFRTSHLARKRLAVRRRHLTPRERQLYDLVFKQHEVDLPSFKALLGAGAKFDRCPAGTILATEGKRHDRVVLITEGEVDISRDGAVVERIGPGSTAAVGGLLGGEFIVRQTTARAATPLSYCYWECAPLKQHFRDEPGVRTQRENDSVRGVDAVRVS